MKVSSTHYVVVAVGFGIAFAALSEERRQRYAIIELARRQKAATAATRE